MAAAAILATLFLGACSGQDALTPSRTLIGQPAGSAVTTAPVGTPISISVPAVGIAASVKPISGTTDIDPPSNDDAFWWTGRAKPGEKDTVYIAGHTLDNGGGVFSPLMKVKPGQYVKVGTTAGQRTYRIDAAVAYAKADLNRYDDVWAVVPGRLILVTCYLDGGQPTNDNFLVYATLVG